MCPRRGGDKDYIISSWGAQGSDWSTSHSSCWQFPFSPSPTSKAHPSAGLGQTASLSETFAGSRPHWGVFLPPSPLSSLLRFYSKHILLCVVHISVHISRLEYSSVIKPMTLEVGQAVDLSPSFLMCDLRKLLNLPRPQFRYPEASLITMPIE